MHLLIRSYSLLSSLELLFRLSPSYLYFTLNSNLLTCIARNFPLSLDIFERSKKNFHSIVFIVYFSIILMSGWNNLIIQKFNENIKDKTQKISFNFHGIFEDAFFSYLDLALGIDSKLLGWFKSSVYQASPTPYVVLWHFFLLDKKNQFYLKIN